MRHAELVRGEGLAGARALFLAEGLDALAGLRPALRDDAQAMPGARVLNGCFTTVRQAIGVRPEQTVAAAFLALLIEELRADGTVQRFIDHHRMTDRLQVGTD